MPRNPLFGIPPVDVCVYVYYNKANDKFQEQKKMKNSKKKTKRDDLIEETLGEVPHVEREEIAISHYVARMESESFATEFAFYSTRELAWQTALKEAAAISRLISADIRKLTLKED